jgi:hypothetical protein
MAASGSEEETREGGNNKNPLVRQVAGFCRPWLPVCAGYQSGFLAIKANRRLFSFPRTQWAKKMGRSSFVGWQILVMPITVVRFYGIRATVWLFVIVLL